MMHQRFWMYASNYCSWASQFRCAQCITLIHSFNKVVAFNLWQFWCKSKLPSSWFLGIGICYAFTVEQPHPQDQCILLFCLSLLECFTPKSAHPLHVLVSSGTHAWLPRICPLVCNQPPVSLPLHPNIYDNRRKKNRLRNSNRILFWSFGQAFGHPPFPLLGSKDALPFIGLLVRFALERQRLYQCTQTILMLKLCLFGQS